MSANIGSKASARNPNDISTEDYRAHRAEEMRLLQNTPLLPPLCLVVAEYTRHFASFSPYRAPIQLGMPEVRYHTTVFRFKSEGVKVACGREVSICHYMHRLEAFTILADGVELQVSSMHIRSHRYERPQRKGMPVYHRARTAEECLGKIDDLLSNPEVLRNEPTCRRLSQMRETLVRPNNTFQEAADRSDAEKLIEEVRQRVVAVKRPVILDFLNDVRAWIALPGVASSPDLVRRLRSLESELDEPVPSTDLSPEQIALRATLKAEVEALR